MTQNYLTWVLPLLEYPETEILEKYTKLTKRGLSFYKWNEILEKYPITHRELKRLLWRLNFFLCLYEMTAEKLNI